MSQPKQNRARVKDNPSLERDLHSNAVLNRDRQSYLKRRKQRKSISEKDRRIAALEAQVASLVEAVKKLTNK